MYRERLPQLDGGLFLTDGGIETTLIFHHGLELPLFAAFDLLKDDEGTDALRRYYATYAALARDQGIGFVLESPTWRASPGWAARLGYTPEQLDALNRKAIALMEELRAEYQGTAPIVISGCVGPEGDGYAPETMLTPEEAERYHAVQIGTFADTAADMVTAITMTYAEEATGVTRAAAAAGIPVGSRSRVETDGRLPSGQTLGGAIQQVDDATESAPAYYMINCAHPTHFEAAVAGGEPWVAADRRPAHERVDEEPRRAGRGGGARRGRSRRPGRAPRRAEGESPGRERARRLLRHRSPARRRDLRRVARRRPRANVENPAHEGLGEGGLRPAGADGARRLAAGLRQGRAARDGAGDPAQVPREHPARAAARRDRREPARRRGRLPARAARRPRSASRT